MLSGMFETWKGSVEGEIATAGAVDPAAETEANPLVGAGNNKGCRRGLL